MITSPAFAALVALAAAGNRPPSVPDVDLDTPEDQSVSHSLVATDGDDDKLAFRIIKPPKNGEAVLTTDGKLTYTPKEHFHGKDALTFEVSDGKDKVVRKVSLAISSVNDRPSGEVQPLKGTEDKPVAGQVKGSDADNDPLAFSVGDEPKAGSVVVTREGRFTFTPAPHQFGAVTFTIRMTDGTVDVDVPVSISLEAVNDAPTADDQSETTKEDVPVKGKLVGEDADKEKLSFALADKPQHGTVQLDAASGAYTYTPTKEYVGDDAFSFSVSDGKLSAKGKVSVTVQNVNDPPTIQALAIEGGEDKVITGKVIAKDYDGDVVYYKLTAEPKHGEAEVDHESGAVSYTPATNYNGADAFVVEASDITGAVTTTVKVTVRPINDPPEIREDHANAVEDEVLKGKVTATDVDKDPLKFSVSRQPRSGTVVMDPGGAYTFTPQQHINGSDSFGYEASDGVLRSVGSLDLHIKPVNDAPTTADVALQTKEDTPVKGRVTGVDIDKDTLSFSLGADGKKGQASVDEKSGAVSYEPRKDENGEDQFTVVVSDGPAQATATVRVNIAEVNDAPVAQPSQKTGDEDHAITGDLIATDVDRDTLTFRALTQPKLGKLDLNPATGAWTLTPTANANGSDGFRFEASDGKLKAMHDVKIELVPVNDVPEAQPLVLGTSEEKPTSGTVIAKDVDKDTLVFSEGVAPKKGTATVDPKSGRVGYAPRLDENGEDSFVIEVFDGKVKSQARISVTIAPINDAPVVEPGSASGSEDATITGTLVARDVDKDTLGYRAVTQPRRGTVVVDPTSGKWTFTPRADENGDDTFRFEVSDGKLSAAADVKLSIAALNDAPVPQALALATTEDKEVNGKLLAKDVDPDVLTWRLKTAPVRGTAAVDDATGALRYRPARDVNGSETFVVEVTDGFASTDASVTVQVAPAPDAPVVDPAPIATAEDTPVQVKLRGTDPDGEQVSFKVLTPSRLGVAELAPDGLSLRFTPNADVHGEDTLVLEGSDGKNRVRATLPVLVAAKNDPPTVDAASAQTDEETPVVLALSAHDRDGDPIELRMVDPPVLGATLDGHLLRVVPARDFAGAITVNVAAKDAAGPGPTQAVVITVINTNDAPVVKDRSLKGAPGRTEVASIDVTDADEKDELTFSIAVAPRRGTLTLDDVRTGKFSYTPAADASGEDSFRLRVKDKAGATASATVRATVTPPPKAQTKPAPAPAPPPKPAPR